MEPVTEEEVFYIIDDYWDQSYWPLTIPTIARSVVALQHPFSRFKNYDILSHPEWETPLREFLAHLEKAPRLEKDVRRIVEKFLKEGRIPQKSVKLK